MCILHTCWELIRLYSHTNVHFFLLVLSKGQLFNWRPVSSKQTQPNHICLIFFLYSVHSYIMPWLRQHIYTSLTTINVCACVCICVRGFGYAITYTRTRYESTVFPSHTEPSLATTHTYEHEIFVQNAACVHYTYIYVGVQYALLCVRILTNHC